MLIARQEMEREQIRDFKLLMKENRQIVLTHQRKRYKARYVSTVWYSAPVIVTDDSDSCCGSRHVVVANNIVFLVQARDGCCTCSPSAKVWSFDTLEELRCHLKLSKRDHNSIAILKVIPGDNDRSPSSSEESRSY